MRTIATVILFFAGFAFGQAKNDAASAKSGTASTKNTMNQIYEDVSHCVTEPEIRGEKDAPISCYCRIAISDARYVYFTYLLAAKDTNLNGTFFVLQENVRQTCGEKNYDFIRDATESQNWKWNGPEVVRTYPLDDVVARISPEMKDGKPTGRWIPFTVQLVYRDAQGRVTRTENYSSREWEPVFPK